MLNNNLNFFISHICRYFKNAKPYGVVAAYRILVPGTPVQTWVGLNRFFEELFL